METGVVDPQDGDRITVREDGDWVIARDEAVGVTSQGKTKIEAIENLLEALELYHEPVPETEEPTEVADAPWL